MKCKVCKKEAVVALQSHNAAFCEKCYLDFFRRQLEKGIHNQKLLNKNDKILVALSGGKDSLALILELYEMGYDVTGLYIDLAIPESSPIARLHVTEFCEKYEIPLIVTELETEGLAIPAIKKIMKRPICSVCGKIKRYYFNKVAIDNGFDVLATGHNLDDEVGRLFSNVLRWDQDYLSRQGPYLPPGKGFVAKVKPLWRLTEFETANYAFIRGIKTYWAPCPFSGGASFSVLKEIFHKLELKMPGRKLDFYQGFLLRGKKLFQNSAFNPEFYNCQQCNTPIFYEGLCGICNIKNFLADKDV